MKKITILFVLGLFSALSPVTIFAQADGQNCSPSGACNAGLSCTGIPPGAPPQSGICRASAGPGAPAGEEVSIGTEFSFGNFINSAVAAAQTPGSFLSSLLPQVYIVALILVLIYLIWGSYRYMMSGGDPKAVQGAQRHLTWAVLGMVVIFISYWLFQLVNSLLLNVF